MRLQAEAVFRPRGDMGRFIEAKVTPAVLAATTKALELIKDTAQSIVPVDTGALRESIEVEIRETGKTVVGVVGPNVPYALYVEFGTGIAGAASAGAGAGPYSTSWPGMPAQPYMRPAVDENEKKIKDLYIGEIGMRLR